MRTIEFQTTIENGKITIPQHFNISNKNVKIAIFDKDLKDKDILHLEIDTKLKNYFTITSIQNYLEQQLQYLLMEQIKSNLDNSITESGIDNDDLLEKTREQAWDSYKDYFLQGVNVE